MLKCGMDLSMTGTGICIMDGSEIIHQKLIITKPIKEKTGRQIKNKKGSEIEEEVSIFGEDVLRINHIKKEILNSFYQTKFLLESHSSSTVRIAIEGPSLGALGQTRSIHTLGKLMGIIESWLRFELNISYTIISPLSLKQLITGKGSGKKEIILKETFKRFNLDFNDNNLCDAFCLCYALSPEINPKDVRIRETKLLRRTK